ncbi:MAG: HEPN domain-containing protein [Lentisphaerae bacterium]|nr:HEPN domain-containing protein [Lentisphaerota bacterium]
MSDELSEWISKAEADYFSAMREYRARKHVNHDAACFHAQQSVEKYLKAVLVDHGIPFPRTHDLLPLLEACQKRHALWAAWHDDVEWLSQYAVLFRYPGESATADDAKKAVGIMKTLCPELRRTLRLSPE